MGHEIKFAVMASKTNTYSVRAIVNNVYFWCCIFTIFEFQSWHLRGYCFILNCMKVGIIDVKMI